MNARYTCLGIHTTYRGMVSLTGLSVDKDSTATIQVGNVIKAETLHCLNKRLLSASAKVKKGLHCDAKHEEENHTVVLTPFTMNSLSAVVRPGDAGPASEH